jgi:Flp pilus assembly protein TadG
MNSKFRFFSPLLRLGKDRLACSLRPLARFLRDEEGSYLLYMTLAFPAFIGFSALATEGALIYYNHRTVQSAADSAAYSAAIAYSIDSDAGKAQTEAEAIVASYWGPSSVGTGNDKVNVDVRPP